MADEVFVVARRSEEFFDAAFAEGEGRRVVSEGEYATLTGAEVWVFGFADRAEAVNFSNVVNGSVYDSEGHARRHARQVAEGQ